MDEYRKGGEPVTATIGDTAGFAIDLMLYYIAFCALLWLCDQMFGSHLIELANRGLSLLFKH